MKHAPGIVLVALSEKINFSITYVNDKLCNLNFQVDSINGIVEVYGRANVFYFHGIAISADIEIRKFQPGTRASTARSVCSELAEHEGAIERKVIVAMNDDNAMLDGCYL